MGSNIKYCLLGRKLFGCQWLAKALSAFDDILVFQYQKLKHVRMMRFPKVRHEFRENSSQIVLYKSHIPLIASTTLKLLDCRDCVIEVEIAKELLELDGSLQ